jgi:hypothetical protein
MQEECKITCFYSKRWIIVKTGPAGCSDVDSGCSQCVILLPVVATMNNSTKHTQDLEPSSNIDCFVFFG